MKYTIVLDNSNQPIWEDENGNLIDRVNSHEFYERNTCIDRIYVPLGGMISLHIEKMLCPTCGEEKEILHNESLPAKSREIGSEIWEQCFYKGRFIIQWEI